MVNNTSPQIHTYHCICSTLILATPYAIGSLPTRSSSAQDQAIILPLPNDSGAKYLQSTLHSLHTDRRPIVIQREDGLEKRMMLRCARCSLAVAYRVLEEDEDVAGANRMFLLPGSLTATEDMKEGKVPSAPSWAAQT